MKPLPFDQPPFLFSAFRISILWALAVDREAFAARNGQQQPLQSNDALLVAQNLREELFERAATMCRRSTFVA
jgi:hypothetical protein